MYLKITYFVLIVGIISCVPSKNLPQNVETNSPEEIKAKKAAASKKMEEGYLPGRIIYSDLADDCEYTIQFKEGEKEFYYVDPIYLEETFKKNGKTVWVKYEGLKRMNRCEKAVPVTILEIENRDE